MATLRFAVVGKPVAHSKSPMIHALFAEQTGIPMAYEAIEVEVAAFDDFIRDFFLTGGTGLNVTLPHKEAAFRLARSLAPRARLAHAVNTLMLDESGELHGDNTDGPGMVRDIESNHGFSIPGKSILILGAGGAARGALPALLARQPEGITILNRTLVRAASIQRDFAGVVRLDVSSYQEFQPREFDLVINATSMSINGEVPPVPETVIGANCCCYDMMYRDDDTAFVAWAKHHRAALALDGFGMLVEQAAESFFLWHGIRPETGPVFRATGRAFTSV